MLEAPPPTSTSCGDAARCFDQAVAVQREKPARAAELFEAACELELPQACSRLADLYEAGRGVTRDDRRAKELRAHACELGSTAACDALGH